MSLLHVSPCPMLRRREGDCSGSCYEFLAHEARYGFMERPHIPELLQASNPGGRPKEVTEVRIGALAVASRAFDWR